MEVVFPSNFQKNIFVIRLSHEQANFKGKTFLQWKDKDLGNLDITLKLRTGQLWYTYEEWKKTLRSENFKTELQKELRNISHTYPILKNVVVESVKVSDDKMPTWLILTIVFSIIGGLLIIVGVVLMILWMRRRVPIHQKFIGLSDLESWVKMEDPKSVWYGYFETICARKV